MDQSWPIKDANHHFYRLGVRRATKGLPFLDEKNPAIACTFSLFFWGAGQSYCGQRMKSVVFQAFMFVFLAGAILSLLYGKEILTTLRDNGISLADAFLSAELVLFCVLIFWAFNARDAYRAATKGRRVPFQGIQSRVLPALTSLLIPGWGQFLNGQPVKGSLLAVFSIFGFFSLATIPAVLLSWPSLEPSRARTAIEAIFTVSTVSAPLIPVICLFSSYDALRVSSDDVKKESILDRMMLVAARWRTQGWMRAMLPAMRTLAVLGLVVASCVIIIGRNYFPVNYVNRYLLEMREGLHRQGMTLVPDVINRLLSNQPVGAVSREKNFKVSSSSRP